MANAIIAFVLVLVLGRLVFRWVRRFRHFSRLRRQNHYDLMRTARLCVKCGYDVRASKGSCSECGWPIGADPG